MQTKELLSQDEISALLETSFTPSAQHGNTSEQKAADTLLADAAGELLRYLQRSGLQAEKAAVILHAAIGEHSRKSFKGKGFRCNLSIENSLAYAFVESLLGGRSSRFEEEDVSGSLDEPLLSLLFRETQKRLQPYLERRSGLRRRHESLFLEFSLGGTRSVMKLVLEPAAAEKQTETPVQKMKVDAVLGVINAEPLLPGRSYRLEDYAFDRIVLLMDNTQAFRGKIVSTAHGVMRLLLEEPLAAGAYEKGYHVCAAGSLLDDEALLALDYGRYLELKLYDDVRIQKDGKPVAKAEIFIRNGDIVVQIIP